MEGATGELISDRILPRSRFNASYPVHMLKMRSLPMKPQNLLPLFKFFLSSIKRLIYVRPPRMNQKHTFYVKNDNRASRIDGQEARERLFMAASNFSSEQGCQDFDPRSLPALRSIFQPSVTTSATSKACIDPF